MSEIIVLNKAPVIFTKDEMWLREHASRIKLAEGALVLLPEDAVLYEPPTVLEQREPPTHKPNKKEKL